MASSGFQCYSGLNVFRSTGKPKNGTSSQVFLNETTENHFRNIYRDLNCGFSWLAFCYSTEHSLGEALGGSVGFQMRY